MGFFTPYDSAPSARNTKKALLAAYEHFADKRIKNVDKGSVFIVDNRTSSDYGADRKLFGWFCTIIANVLEEDKVEISMRGGLPRSAQVDKWIKENAEETGSGISFVVTPENLLQLGSLARAIQSIVRPGARYSVKAYKYVCPRTAGALSRLQTVLAEHWTKVGAQQ